VAIFLFEVLMKKIQIILFGLFISLFFLMTIIGLKIKAKYDLQQKTLLALQIGKAVEYLMPDLREARENTIRDVPPDGLWHHRIAFIQNQQGGVVYMVKEGRLFRVNRGKVFLIADDISDLRIRRQSAFPDILEVQIEARKNVSLISNFKIRVHP
jgi:hypothetical protein